MSKKREFQETISLATDVIAASKEELDKLRVEEDELREKEKVVGRKKARRFSSSPIVLVNERPSRPRLQRRSARFRRKQHS